MILDSDDQAAATEEARAVLDRMTGRLRQRGAIGAADWLAWNRDRLATEAVADDAEQAGLAAFGYQVW